MRLIAPVTTIIKAKKSSSTAGVYTRIDRMMIASWAPESILGIRNEIEQKMIPNTAIAISELGLVGIKLMRDNEEKLSSIDNEVAA